MLLYNKYANSPSRSIPISPGRELQTRIADLSLDEICLDPENPRLSNEIRKQKYENTRITDGFLEDLVEMHGDISMLVKGILQTGKTADPIIVHQSNSGGKKYIKEGNCRYVAYKRLSLTNPKFLTISCEILPPDTTEEEIKIILMRLHVAPKLDWYSINCAEHVNSMYTGGKTYDEIATICRWNRDKVKSYLETYRQHAAYQKEYRDYDHKKFSDFLKYVQYCQKDMKKMKMSESEKAKFDKWFKDLVFNTSKKKIPVFDENGNIVIDENGKEQYTIEEKPKLSDCRHCQHLVEMFRSPGYKKIIDLGTTSDAFNSFNRGSTEKADPFVDFAERGCRMLDNLQLDSRDPGTPRRIEALKQLRSLLTAKMKVEA